MHERDDIRLQGQKRRCTLGTLVFCTEEEIARG